MFEMLDSLFDSIFPKMTIQDCEYEGDYLVLDVQGSDKLAITCNENTDGQEACVIIDKEQSKAVATFINDWLEKGED